MKTKILLITITLLLSTTLIAASDRSRDNRGDRIAKKLNLTADQQAKFESVMKNKREKMKAARQAINAETKAELSTFLSEEQMAELKQTRENRIEKIKHKRQHKKMRRAKKSQH